VTDLRVSFDPSNPRDPNPEINVSPYDQNRTTDHDHKRTGKVSPAKANCILTRTINVPLEVNTALAVCSSTVTISCSFAQAPIRHSCHFVHRFYTSGRMDKCIQTLALLLAHQVNNSQFAIVSNRLSSFTLAPNSV
jgi:hypothetical protein